MVRMRLLVLATTLPSLQTLAVSAVLNPYTSVGFFKQGTYFPERVTLNEEFGGTSLSRSYSGGDPYANYSGFASARIGTLGAAASIDSNLAFTLFTESFSAESYFVDRLTVRPRIAGGSTMYRFAPAVRLSGTAAWDEGIGFPILVQIAQWIKLANGDWQIHDAAAYQPGMGTVDVSFTLPAINVPPNEAFNYALQLWVTASVFGSTGVLAGIDWSRANFHRTLTVTGFDIRDEQGNLTAVSITSGSGAMYSAEMGIADGSADVPEPDTFVTAVSAVLAVVVLRGTLRNRRREP
jgi:hypothetical protein